MYSWNIATQELIENNRLRLRLIVDCIITCGRQNLALRGHRDDAHHYLDEEDSTNPGNFIEILKYGARCSNLKDLLFDNCLSNQTYRSKTIQNEIINICGEIIFEKIIEETKDAKFFTILADEATVVLTWNRWRLFCDSWTIISKLEKSLSVLFRA